MPLKETTSCLSPTTSHMIDRPMSRFSVASETATFYSALDSPLSPSISSHSIASPNCINSNPRTRKKESRKDISTQATDPPKLSRQDSGYAAYTSSTLSSLKTPSPKLRPKKKRSSQTQLQRKKPCSLRKKSSLPQLWHPQPQLDTSQTKSRHQRSSFTDKKFKYLLERRYFSEFSTLTQNRLNTDQSPPSEESPQSSNFTSPFPPTINYWTSDDSRRLEYAAIDAASKGVRGFLVRMIPDFILPPQIRRTKFWAQEGEGKQREGSVRRYRLAIPEESDKRWTENTEKDYLGSGNKEKKFSRPGIIRRWSAGLKISRS